MVVLEADLPGAARVNRIRWGRATCTLANRSLGRGCLRGGSTKFCEAPSVRRPWREAEATARLLPVVWPASGARQRAWAAVRHGAPDRL